MMFFKIILYGFKTEMGSRCLLHGYPKLDQAEKWINLKQ